MHNATRTRVEPVRPQTLRGSPAATGRAARPPPPLPTRQACFGRAAFWRTDRDHRGGPRGRDLRRASARRGRVGGQVPAKAKPGPAAERTIRSSPGRRRPRRSDGPSDPHSRRAGRRTLGRPHQAGIRRAPSRRGRRWPGPGTGEAQRRRPGGLPGHRMGDGGSADSEGPVRPTRPGELVGRSRRPARGLSTPETLHRVSIARLGRRSMTRRERRSPQVGGGRVICSALIGSVTPGAAGARSYRAGGRRRLSGDIDVLVAVAIAPGPHARGRLEGCRGCAPSQRELKANAGRAALASQPSDCKAAPAYLRIDTG
jgi:hypothetical protein